MGRRRILRSKRRSPRNPELKDPFGKCVRVIDPFDGTVKEICPERSPSGTITSDLKDPFKSIPLGTQRLAVGRHDRYGISAHMKRQRSGSYDCNDMCYRYCDWRFDAISERNNNRGCHGACNNLCGALSSGRAPQKKRRRRLLRVGRLQVGRCYGARYGGRY